MEDRVIFYTYPSCASCRKVKEWLTKHAIPYVERHLYKDPPSTEELKTLFEMTTYGTDELLSKRSQTYKNLSVPIDDLSLSELMNLIREEPRLLKRPIITYGEHLIVGFNKEALEALLA